MTTSVCMRGDVIDQMSSIIGYFLDMQQLAFCHSVDYSGFFFFYKRTLLECVQIYLRLHFCVN